MSRVLSLFAGSGWGVACQQLGWPEDGVDNAAEVRQTRMTAGMTNVGCDVRDVTVVAGGYDGQIASPSCKRYTTTGNGAGRRAIAAVLQGVGLFRAGRVPSWQRLAGLVGDEDAALTLEPLRLALAGRPRFVVWEQVPSVLPIWQACAEVLQRRGYSSTVGVLRAEQYGVPQVRRRVFLLARCDGVQARMPTPTHSRFYARVPDRLDTGVARWVSMADTLGWDPGCQVVSNYSSNGDPASRGVRPATHPAVTITSKADRMRVVEPRPGGRPYKRRLTDPEAAALQTYPAGFVFCGTKNERSEQIGNAVPPRLALTLLRQFDDEQGDDDAAGVRVDRQLRRQSVPA